jgi:putative molybdopterin biosynthesis protein
MIKIKLGCSLLLSDDAPTHLDNLLFKVLDGIYDGGSIQEAAIHSGLTYRHIWGYIKKWEESLGIVLVEKRRGQGANLSDKGEKLLWAMRRSNARVMPQLEDIASSIEREINAALIDSARPIVIHASHDLALSAIQEKLAKKIDRSLDIQVHGSLDCLVNLSRGKCDFAGFHLAETSKKGKSAHLAYRNWLRVGKHKLINFARREQGLIVAKGNPKKIHTMQDLTRHDISFINRQRTAGTRLEIDQLLRDAHIKPSSIEGYENEEFTHLAVAATVAAGMADAGFGLRAAAEKFKLGFIPLVTERYFFVCTKEKLSDPSTESLIAYLKSKECKTRIGAMVGYDASECGEIVSLKLALPWYKHHAN